MPLWAQQINPDADREIIVMFRPNVIQLPVGLISAPFEQVVFVSPQLRATLLSHGVDQVGKTFPEFVSADTLAITSEGWTVKSLDLSRVFTLRLSTGQDRTKAIDDLKRLPEVIYAEPNTNARLRLIPNDTDFSRQWNMHNTGQYGGTSDADIDAPEAWDIYQGSSSVLIAIVDGGVNTNHTDLSGRVSGNTGSSNHATHVAGIAAAKGNNSFGVAGVDWNCSINSQITGDIPQTAAAVRAAVNAGARIINDSWGQGSNDYSVTLADAFAYAYKSNAVSCVAMPEEGSPEDYPNNYGQGIVNVGATTNTDQKASYSYAKVYIDVAAPGGNADGVQERNIYSTLPNNSFDYMAGTSMAAPHATGIASLLKGYGASVLGKTLYNDDIEQIIRLGIDDVNSGTYPGWDQYLGTGRVNAHKALDLLRSPYTFSQPPTASGGSDYSSTGTYTMAFFSTPGLADGVYIVKRHEVRKSITFPYTYQSAPYTWGRGVATNGYSIANPNFGMGWCEPVAGTVTTTGATFRTYVYEVWNIAGQWVGWKPTTPSGVTFAYTVNGILNPVSVYITGPTELGWKQRGTWTANPSGGNGYYTYEWRYRYNGTGPWSEVVGTSQTHSRTMINTDFELQVKVTSQGLIAYDTHYVEYAIGKSVLPPLTENTPLPEAFILAQNFPNPFNPETEIRFGLPEEAHVQMVVIDLLGREVRKLVDSDLKAGYHSVVWDGRDHRGLEVPSGIYFYTLQVGEKVFKRKLTLLK